MAETVDRLSKLQKMLDRQPGDPFTLYAIGLEHKKAGRAEQAIEFLDRCIQFDPGYCYAFFQKGQILESTGDIESAKAAYRQGINAATLKGDNHARSELEGALQMIE